MSTSERIPQPRLVKLQSLKNRGVDPYPARFQRTQTNSNAVALLVNQEESQSPPVEVTVAGRITAIRGMGKLAFIDLLDSSGKLQLYVNKSKLEESSAELLGNIDIGDFLGATGVMVRTRTLEPSVDVKTLTMLAKSLLPLPEKWHGLQV